MITQTLDLNLIPGRVLPMVNVSQYDKDSRTLEFTIYNGDQSFDLTGLTAYIQGLKPDGHGFNYSATVSTGKITADVTEQMTAVSGRVMCEVIIMSGADRIGTGNFILNVEAAAMPDGSNMSESEYAYIQELIEEAQEVVEEAEGYVEDAEAWAVGEKGGVPVPSTDPTYQNNSKYYAEQAQQYAQGGLHYMGSVLFANIPITGMAEGDMYNIEDDFVTDSRFQEGVGIHVAAGSNIAWNTNNKWDVLAPIVSDMTGATALLPGTHGLVPAPAAGQQDYNLKGDGTWGAPIGDMTGAGLLTPGAHGLVPAPAAGDQDKFLKGDGTWDNVPAAGHTIQNASGTDLTQRDTLQFKGGLKASDDNVNKKTVVDGAPTEITWAQYNALSPAEQAALEHTLVTDVPGADGTISADILTKLWENPSPTSAFAAQNITLSSSDYDYLMLITNFNTNASTSISTTIAEKGQNILASCGYNGGTQERIFAYNSATSYSAYDAKSGQSVSNTVCIPLAIYGIKKTVTVKFDALARDVSTLASNCMLSDGVTSVEDVIDEGKGNTIYTNKNGITLKELGCGIASASLIWTASSSVSANTQSNIASFTTATPINGTFTAKVLTTAYTVKGSATGFIVTSGTTCYIQFVPSVAMSSGEKITGTGLAFMG